MSYTTVYSEVEVEVSLNEFEFEDIVEYINETDTHRVVQISDDASMDEVSVLDLYHAYRNKDESLMEKLRSYIQNKTGRILP